MPSNYKSRDYRRDDKWSPAVSRYNHGYSNDAYNSAPDRRRDRDKNYNRMEAKPNPHVRFSTSAVRDKDFIKVNFTNLASTVTTRDLKELIGFPIVEAVVHYDERGYHLGIADVHVSRRQTAEDIKTLRGFALDGRALKMNIVSDKPPIATRISYVRTGPTERELRNRSRGSSRHRSRSPRTRGTRRSPANHDHRTHHSRSPNGERSRRVSSGWRDKKNLPTVAELDRELELYTKKTAKKHPLIVVD